MIYCNVCLLNIVLHTKRSAVGIIIQVIKNGGPVSSKKCKVKSKCIYFCVKKVLFDITQWLCHTIFVTVVYTWDFWTLSLFLYFVYVPFNNINNKT